MARPRHPPGKDGKGKDGKGPPPRYELGQVFPPPLQAEVKLSAEQEKALATIRKDLKAKLEQLLTDEQKKTVNNFRTRGPGGPGGPPAPAPEDSPVAPGTARLTLGGALNNSGEPKSVFALEGDAVQGALGGGRNAGDGAGGRCTRAEVLGDRRCDRDEARGAPRTDGCGGGDPVEVQLGEELTLSVINSKTEDDSGIASVANRESAG